MVLLVVNMKSKRKNRVNTINSRMVNEEILFEMGPGTVYWLEEQQIDLDKLKYIIVSDFSAEHFSDMVVFLLDRLERENPALVSIIGPKDILDRVVALMVLFDNDINNNNVKTIEHTYNVKFIGLENEIYDDKNISLQRVTTKTLLKETHHYNIVYHGEKLKYETISQ